jgi:hypothetical protein
MLAQPVAPDPVPPAQPVEYDSDEDEVSIHEILFGTADNASAKGWASEHQAQYTYVGAGPPAAPQRTFMQYSPQQQLFMPPSNALFMRAPLTAPEPVAAVEAPAAAVEAKEQVTPPPEQAAPPAEEPAKSKTGGNEKPRRRLRSHEFHCYGRANTSPSTGGFVFGDYMTTHNAKAGAHLPIRRRSPNSEANSDGAQIHLMERDRRLSLAPGGLARSQPARSAARTAPKQPPRQEFDFFEAQAPAPPPAPPPAPKPAPKPVPPTVAAAARDMYATLPAYDPSAYVPAPTAPHAPQPPQIQMQWAPQWMPPAAAPPPAQFAWLPPDIAQLQQAQAQAQAQAQQAQQAQAQAQAQQAQEQWQQWQQWQQQQMAAYMAATAAPPPAPPPPPFAPDEPGVRNAPSNYKHVPGLMRSVPPAGTRSKRRDNLSN